MLAHPGIIITGLHGWVIGGGFEYLLGCDLRIAATDFRIMLPEIGVGLFFSNASAKLLPHIAGKGKAKEIILLGQEISAEEALNSRLVNRVCKPESLNRILKNTANKIIQKDQYCLQLTKKFINENQDIDIEGILGRESIAVITTGQAKSLK